MTHYFGSLSDVEYGNSSRTRDFHRGTVHNPKLYQYDNNEEHLEIIIPKYHSKLCKSNSPRFHSLNNTFTIGITNEKQRNKKTVTRLPKVTEKVKTLQYSKPRSYLQPQYHVHKHLNKHNFNPYESFVKPNSTNIAPKQMQEKNKTQGTQTPRFAVPNRQKKSVENFVERNRKLHNEQNTERIRFFENNSLTFMPRVYLPRLNLYSKALECREPIFSKEIKLENKYPRNDVYDSHADDRGGRHCCVDRNLHSSSNGYLDSDESDSVIDCIHYSNPQNQKPIESFGNCHHGQEHYMKPPSNPKKILQNTQNLKHIQVLKSPIMWSNEKRHDPISNDSSDSSGNEWTIDCLDEPEADLPKSVFKPETFDFWRDDNNFGQEESSIQNIADKRVRFD